MFGLTPFGRYPIQGRRNDLDAFHNMINDFFNDSWPFDKTVRGADFKIDIRENDAGYLIEAELPGVSKEDIKLNATGEQITISVSREENKEEEKGQYLHRERRNYAMQRTINLPSIKYDGIGASFKDGILEITVPKADSDGASTQIEIQ